MKSSKASPALKPSPVTVSERSSEKIPDDRENLIEGDPVLLIVEDDPHYARLLSDLSHEKGFKVLVASRGTEALDLAREFHPTAVSLDVFLPDMLGWTVLNHFKQDPTMRHITGSDVDPGRGSAAWPRKRGICLCYKTNHARRTRCGFHSHQGIHDAASQETPGG